MPYMNISSIILSKTTDLRVNDDIIAEICINNTSDAGDIFLKFGFGYLDIDYIVFLGSGQGKGYVTQEIGGVTVGETFCPYGVVSVDQEVIDAVNASKDVKFYVIATPGTTSNKYLTFAQIQPQKEIVFPFSKQITITPKIQEWINKIVVLLGGKSAYFEDGTKIVVVL